MSERLAKLERQMKDRDANVDQQFRHVFSLLEQLFTPPAGQALADWISCGEVDWRTTNCKFSRPPYNSSEKVRFSPANGIQKFWRETEPQEAHVGR